MKTKLLTFLGLVVASVSMSLVFVASPVHAEGEEYRWIDENTIRASGGLYHDVTAANDGVIDFEKSGNVYTVFSDGSCDITLTIRASIDNRSGTLETEGCDSAAEGFDRSFTIADPDKGPPLGGEEVDYSTVNCSEYYEGGLNVHRCNAVKSCIEDGNSKDECLSGWATCMINEADGETPTSDTYQACEEQVGSGQLPDPQEGDEEAGAVEDTTTCAVDGVGWIICPIITLLANLVDAAYSFVASLLVVQPLLTTGDTKGIYDAWGIMRSFANVAFVVAFLIIIFSQLTSIGITNYGIKKMLPRLILAAILVNVSYWICAIAVDISNVLGSSVKGIFDSLEAGLELPAGGAFSGNNGWTNLAGSILAGGAVIGIALYVGLSALIPALLIAGLAIVTVFIVLTIRQALIILLIVVAPLAFVAYLLPNTESWFNKWKGLLWTLLAMYPIIAGLFGAASFASQIIMASTDDVAVQVMGALVAIVPLALTPLIMKTAGGVLGKVGAVINNPNRGPVDRLRKRGEAYRKRRQNISQARRLGGKSAFSGARASIYGDGTSKFRRGVAKTIGTGENFASNRATASLTREQMNANAEKALATAKQDYIADRVATEAADGKNDYARQLAGPTGDVARIQALAIAAKKNETAEAIKNAQISANIPPGQLGLVAEKLKEAVKDNDSVMARAMQNILMTSGSKGLDKYRNAMNELEGTTTKDGTAAMQSEAVTDMRDNMLTNHGGVKGSAADLINHSVSGGDLSAISTNASTWENMPDEELVKQKETAFSFAANSGAITPEQAHRIKENPELVKSLSPASRRQVEGLASLHTPPTPPPTPPTPSS